MKNGSGIILLSFPFAAGVSAAALAAMPFEGALAGSVAVALALACACFSKRGTVPLLIMYFCLGFCCWCSNAACPPPPPPQFARPLADALEALLDSIPFDGENSGAIIKALLTGRRSGLPASTVAAFRRSGASHILALSGLHLGIIYACIRRILSIFGNSPTARIVKSISTIALCGLYSLATGASPSIIRALLFIIINEAGRAMSGRRHSPLGTFCLALTLQLAARPLIISSVGFQLSYLAMLGITILYPRLKAWYPEGRRGNPLRAIWKSASLSISCQVFTAPVAWYHFRSFPVFFLITNLIALPITEVVIIGAVAAAVMQATFGCPPALSLACGKAVQLLEFCLETIAQ